MRYYRIDTDYEPKVTGKRDADTTVEKSNHSFQNKNHKELFNRFFLDNYKNKSKITFDYFQIFDCDDKFRIIYFPKTKSIKELDFMAFGPYEHGLQFLVSQRVYEILSEYRLPMHHSISAEISGFSGKYILLGFPIVGKNYYNFKTSVFFDSDRGVDIVFDSLTDYISAGYEGSIAEPKKIFLNIENKYDVIGTTKGIFFSEPILEDFKSNKITGYIIERGILEL